MASLEERIAGVIAELKRLDRTAPVVVVDEIGWRVDRLADEVRTSVTDEERRRTLLNQARLASGLVAEARERAERAIDIAVAKLQRELYDAEHPTITSPQPQRQPRPGRER
ncbi:hypothetical protein [Nocardia amamiensis]|uniref:hypothetical protein n=1 Tax=Nocardia amamiensis TaxID=404578 RepID=UPI0008321104|nr:hypothetical protein [Nocardia amamiensis]